VRFKTTAKKHLLNAGEALKYGSKRVLDIIENVLRRMD
jgi:hypothetical protein